MYCPKCGTENPETGKFCRSCGTDLGNVSAALSGKLAMPHDLVDKKGKPVNWEGAITKSFTGVAFLIIAIILGVTNMAGGRVWWFWMLIPAFSMMGAGLAQYMQLKKLEQGRMLTPAANIPQSFPAAPQPAASLPPDQTPYVSPESKYKTGDLVPPSVTETTTKHLEINSEGETMTLPKPQ